MSIIAYIANIFRGELGRGKRNSSFFDLHSSLSFILSIALLFVTSGVWAADWTDEDGNTYTALKYIKGTATAYNANGGWIVLDFKPNSTDIVKMRFRLATTSWNQYLWCNRAGSSSNSSKFGAYVDSSGNFQIQCNSSNFAGTTSPGTDDCTIEVNYSTGKFYVNGIEQTAIIGEATPPATKTMLFASNVQGTSSASSRVIDESIADKYVANRGSYYLYDFQLYSSTGELKHNLMPAKNMKSNAVGLYDTVTSNFYAKATNSGDFIAEEWGSDRTGKKWTGAGSNNLISNGDNWEGGVAPVAGDDLDFTIAVPNAPIYADTALTYGTVYLGMGDLPAFTGSLTATAINDLARMQTYDTATDAFTFELAAPSGQDFAWNSEDAANWWNKNVWTYDNAASSWYDYNNAIFSTAGATVTLDANATANSLEFNANATITGSGVLTVPSVTVVQDVTGTISAPTAGPLEKTGAGTLVLGSPRSDATVLSEGTLVMSGEGTTLDWSKLTLGDAPAKPVTLRFEDGAGLANPSSEFNFGNVPNVTSVVCKAGVDWTHSGVNRIGRAAGANTTFVNESGNLTFTGYINVGAQASLDDAASTDMIVAAGTVSVSRAGSGAPFISIGSYGAGTLTVTNSGVFNVKASMALSIHSGSGTLNVSDGGTATIGTELVFGWSHSDAGAATVNLGTGGTLAASTVRCADHGTGTVKFDGGTLKAGAAATLIQSSDLMTVNVGANGGTIDNNGMNISIAQKMRGVGGMTFSGFGTTTISANQEYTGTTTVSEGTTLSVGGGVTFAGSVEFKSGSKLNIANYTAGVTPFTAQSLILPEDEGKVSLTLNGGAFGKGIYAICAAPGVTAADGDKFTFTTTDELIGTWSVDDDTLILTVGEIPSNYWTGRGGDGKMSTGANWGSGEVPAAGSDIDLSGISADTTIIADAGRTFGEVTMGTGVITFTGEFTATSFTDTSKIAVGADSTVTVLGDLEFGAAGRAYICDSVAERGKFEVSGDIIITPEQTLSLLPCVVTVNEGVISAKGLVSKSSDDLFALSWFKDNASAKWLIGENGICCTGTGAFYVGDKPGVQATIIAATDFVVSAHIISWRNLTFDTAGYTVTLGTNTLAKSGGISGSTASATRSIEVRGRGKVVVNYNVNDLTTSPNSRNNAFTVTDGATLALNPGANIGTGLLTIKGGAALEIPESGMVTHNGNLSLENGAALAFNFTDRKTAPVLALAEGKAVAFTGEGEIAVKITGDAWPIGGDYVLTTCGGFDAEGVTVSLAYGAPKWAKGIGVNEEGDIVLTVRPKPTMIIVR